jgi:hypothetical protein
VSALAGLVVDRSRLQRVIDAQTAIATARTRAIENGDDPNAITIERRIVSAEVVASTAERFPGCKCDELGLEAGMPVASLATLSEGCTAGSGYSPGFVCPRLDTVRRTYGK